MAVIVSHRYTIHAGEEHPRLNRDQRITAVLPPQPSEKLQNIIDWVTYGISDNYYRRLGKLYVDEIVYLDQWKTFAAHCAKDWKVAITWSGPSLICSVLMSMTPAASPALALLSALVNGGSILSAVTLTTQQDKLLDIGIHELVSVQFPDFEVDR